MTHFYMTLPSNSSMGFYPNNTVTKYTTKLHGEVNLRDSWEVGLSEITIPRSWFNIRKYQLVRILYSLSYKEISPETVKNVQIIIPDFVKELVVYIKQGLYESVQSLVDHVNERIIEEHDRLLNNKGMIDVMKNRGTVSLKYDKGPNIVKIVVPYKTTFWLSEDLCDAFGFKQQKIHENLSGELEPIIFSSYRPAALDVERRTIYVYCDILESIPVGDTQAPLLRIINVDGESRNSIVHKIFERPHYIPIRKPNFDSLEIDIRDGFGRPLPFESGTSIVTLHFRRSQSSYFTI